MQLMFQIKMMIQLVLLLLSPLIVDGFSSLESRANRARLSVPSNPAQIPRRPRQATSVIRQAAEDTSASPSGAADVDLVQQAEQAREQLQIQLKEAENRRIQLEQAIQTNAKSVEEGQQNLQSNLQQNENDIQELKELQKVATNKFNLGNIQFPTLETIAQTAKQVPTQTWLGTALGASVGGLALGRFNLQRRRKLQEEQEYQQRLAEAEAARNLRIAEANRNRERFLAAGSTLVVGAAVTGLVQFSQKDSSTEQQNTKQQKTEKVVKSKNKRKVDESTTVMSQGPAPDLPYLEQRIQTAENQVKDSQQNLQNTAEARKVLQMQMEREVQMKQELTQKLEETVESIRQAKLAKDSFEADSQMNTQQAAVDLIAVENPQSSATEKMAAQEQAKKAAQMAEAQRLAAFAESQRISEMKQQLDEEVMARMELLQKLQSTEASLKQANDRAQLAALEAQMAKDTKDQALAQANEARGKIIAEAMASKDKALAEAMATTQKALAEKQQLELQAAEEKQKTQMAVLEAQRIAESNERAKAQVLEAELMAADAKAQAEAAARMAMQLQQEQAKPPSVSSPLISSVSTVQAGVTKPVNYMDTRGISDTWQRGFDAFQAKGDETAFVTQAAVDELMAGANLNAFRQSPMGRYIAASVGDENLPTAAAAIVGTGVAATGFVAAAMKKAQENNEPEAAAATGPASTNNPFQSYNPSQSEEPRKNSFFTSKDPRTDMTKQTNFFTNTDSYETTPPGFQTNNFFTKTDSFEKSPGFLSGSGKKSAKGETNSSTGRESSKGGFSSKGFGSPNFATGAVMPISTTASAPASPKVQAPKVSSTPSFGSAKGVTSMTPGSPQGSNGFKAPALGLSKTSSSSSSPIGSASSAFGKTTETKASNFGSPTSSKGTNNSFGTTNGSTSATGKSSGFSTDSFASSKSSTGLGSNSFGSTAQKSATSFGAATGSDSLTTKRSAANGFASSTTSSTTMDSKGQNNSAGFGQRNGAATGTMNSSPTGPNNVASSSPKGFSPYGSKGSFATSAKGSTQSKFNPSNSPFGGSSASSSSTVDSTRTTTSSSPKGYRAATALGATQSSQSFNPSNSPLGNSNGGESSSSTMTSSPPRGNTTPGATQLNQSSDLSNSPFRTSNGIASPVSKTVPQSNPSSAKGSNQSSFNPSNSPFGNRNAASSTPAGSWKPASTTSSTNIGGYNPSNPSSGASQSSQSFNPSNSAFGNTNGLESNGAGSTRRAETATNDGTTSPSMGFDPTNPSSGSRQSSQSSFNPSNSPFANNGASATTGGTSSRNTGSGISTGYNPSNPGLGTAKSSSPQTSSSVQPGMASSQGINQGALNSRASSVVTRGLNQNPLSAAPNPFPSIAGASSSKPLTTDTSEEEQRWRESKPSQGDWWNVEKKDYFTTLGRRESRSFTGRNIPVPEKNSPGASSYSPFGNSNQPSQKQSSIQSYSPPNQGDKAIDTSQEEQLWRQSTSPGSQWFETERLDHYTDRGLRVTRSFTGNAATTSSLSSYSPFGQQNSQTTQQSSIPSASSASNAITSRTSSPNNNYSNQGRTAQTIDASELEQRWREASGTPGGQWYEQEKLDFYTSRGTRATRSFNGGGTTEDVGPNQNLRP